MLKTTRRFFIESVAALSAASVLPAFGEAQTKTATEKPASPLEILPAGTGKVSPGDQIAEHLEHLAWVREHFGLKIAYCQHPMYLIIDEDRGEPPVGERTPPWGAVKAADYVERIRRNLASLDKLPGLRLNYDFAAFDLETILRDYPDVIAEMQRMQSKGVLEFVNGSYSQGHPPVYGSEANWRDFEYGAEVYQHLFKKKVTVFGFQEGSFHEQLPQVLRRFGYSMIVAPQFVWFMEIQSGPIEIMTSHQGSKFMLNDEFVEAQALDGSSLPMYLTNPVPEGMPGDLANFKKVLDADMYGPAPIWPYFPDMDEVDETKYQQLSILCDFVLFGPALAERIKLAPPRAKARLTNHWSYAEGVWAEELLRANRKAEETALLAESLQAMAKLAGESLNHEDALHRNWRNILKFHNHDVHWIEVTDLRRKGIQELSKSASTTNQICGELARSMVPAEASSIAVFNALPRARAAIIDTQSDKVPGHHFQRFEGRALGICELPPGGYRSFPASEPKDSYEVSLPKIIKTNHYTIQLSETGLMRGLTTATGNDLLRSDEYLGGELRAMIEDEWKNNRSATCRFFEGPVCYILTRSTSLADIPVQERYFYFRDFNAIKVELEFDFHGNTISYFWLDETKLNVYYPTRGSHLHHDIAFGYVEAHERQPLLAPNWVHCGGLTYINRGTVKHWVRNGVIANVLAWGSNHFDNRMHYDGWTERQEYDLRLYGNQKVEYWLVPYDNFDGVRVVQDAIALASPVFALSGAGEKSYYEIRQEDLASTAIFHEDGEVRARGYRIPSERQSPLNPFEIYCQPIKTLS
jgi:hypothetical protein